MASAASSSGVGWLSGRRLGVVDGAHGGGLASSLRVGFAWRARGGREVFLCGGEGGERRERRCGVCWVSGIGSG